MAGCQIGTGPSVIQMLPVLKPEIMIVHIISITNIIWCCNHLKLLINLGWSASRWLFSWWRHQMETFCTLLTLCAGSSLVTGEFPAQGPVPRRFDVSLISAWINGWVNNHEEDDLRRHRAHYDVNVMGRLAAGSFVVGGFILSQR